MTINTKENQKILISFILGALICFLVLNFQDRNKMKIDLSVEKQNTSKVVAKVDNQDIYADEVNLKLMQIGQNLVFDDLKKEEKELLVKEVFVQDLVLKNAIKNKSYENYSPSLKRFAIEETKNNYLEEESKKQVTDKLVQEKYQEIVDAIKGKKESLVSHILTKDKTQINKAFRALNSKSFEEVVKKYSVDSATAQNNGEIGYIVEGSTMPEFDKQIQKLKSGKISRPFKTNLGWHIIKVSNIREVVLPKLEEVQDRIEQNLVSQNKKQVAAKLIENSKIEIF